MMDDGTRLRNRINKQVYPKYQDTTVDLVWKTPILKRKPSWQMGTFENEKNKFTQNAQNQL